LPFSSILFVQTRGFLSDKMNAPSSWVKLTRLRLRYAARFLLNFFKVKLGFVYKNGGQLTQFVVRLNIKAFTCCIFCKTLDQFVMFVVLKQKSVVTIIA